MGRKKNKTPAHQVRAQHLQAHRQAGSGMANLWHTKCLYTGQDLVFNGDRRIEHFYACEGDPQTRRAWYGIEPVQVTLHGTAYEVRFDAKVELLDGTLEYRTVGAAAAVSGKSEDVLRVEAFKLAAQRLGGVYRPITLADLDRVKQRVLNWRRGLRFVRASWPAQLNEAESIVRARIEQRRTWPLGELIMVLGNLPPPLVVAAVMRLMHKRVLSSDLDTQMLSTHTQLSVIREAA